MVHYKLYTLSKNDVNANVFSTKKYQPEIHTVYASFCAQYIKHGNQQLIKFLD